MWTLARRCWQTWAASLCQNGPLDLDLFELAAQLDEFPTFGSIQGYSIRWCALDNGGTQANLAHPVKDGGHVAAKFFGQLTGLAPCLD